MPSGQSIGWRRKMIERIKSKEIIWQFRCSIIYAVTIDGQQYALKETEDSFNCPVSLIAKSYERYQKIQHIPGMLKIYDFKIKGNKAYTLMEYLKDYFPLTCLRKDAKDQALLQVMTILSDMLAQGYVNLDLDILNFLISGSGTVKMIDLDQVIAVEDFGASQDYWFRGRMFSILRWYGQ